MLSLAPPSTSPVLHPRIHSREETIEMKEANGFSVEDETVYGSIRVLCVNWVKANLAHYE
jgi:hypothetical protein